MDVHPVPTIDLRLLRGFGVKSKSDCSQDLQDDEDPEEKERKHKELEVCCVYFTYLFHAYNIPG